MQAEQNFQSNCQSDPNVDSKWASYQEIFAKFEICTGAYQIVAKFMPDESPNTPTTLSSKLLNVEECRIENDPAVDIVRAFPNKRQGWLKNKLHPSPDTVYQVIPLTSPDAPNLKGNSPEQDYGKYLSFIKDWTEYVTDGESKVTFDIPDSYIEFPKEIAPYRVGHKNWDDPGNLAFARDVSKIIAGKIDISKADMILIVVPEGTKLSVIEQGPVLLTQNGKRHRSSTALSPGLTSDNADPTYNLWFSHPMGVLHELFHIGPGLEDHMGDAHETMSGLTKNDHLGTGHWGLMSSGQTDLLAWEKWFLGFLDSKQVRCAPRSEKTIHWLAPSTVKTNAEKLLVIPLGKHEALIVESMRASGLNYKIPKTSEGALVYHLNASEPRRDYAYRLLTSDDRQLIGSRFRLEDWPLKVGESLNYKGIKLSVLEAGEFGDVVQVEPSN